ncbi:uncharacterized protein LOC132607790 [Lycium barbarum]|uniref:uncharacterized protein LOC132607790 n=1 Tax=Lycium barbarum TaxID=112863 RepID=UPI00293F552F|nr:uncharacterized protein LOC132607790 [Lycium barbarum]
MDFVMGLPKTLGKFNSVWVIVDRLTKSVYFIPVQATYNAEKVARIYIRDIVRLHEGVGYQLDLSTAFHPYTDGQFERTNQWSWGPILALAEFAYGNNYHSSIDMAPLEALYGIRFRSSIGLFDSLEVKMIQEKLLEAQSRKKEYADQKVRDLEFMEVAYELALRPGLSGVHLVFHVSMLKKYHSDGSYIIHWDSIFLDENLSYEKEPIAILDRQVTKLRLKEITSVKVQRKHRPVEEAIWVTEFDMRTRYPQLFTDSGTFPLSFEDK